MQSILRSTNKEVDFILTTNRISIPVNLEAAAEKQLLPGSLYSADSGLTLRFLFRDASGHDIIPEGLGVRLYAIRSDGATVIADGELLATQATVLLPDACLACPGQLLLSLCLLTESGRRIVWSGETQVRRTDTDAVIDPGTIIPSLSELLAQVDRLAQLHPATICGYYADLDALDANVLRPQTGEIYGLGSDSSYTYVIRDGSDWVDLGDIMRPTAASAELWSGSCAAGSKITVAGLSAWSLVMVSIGTVDSTLAIIPCAVSTSTLTGMGGYPSVTSSGARTMVSFGLHASVDEDTLTLNSCGSLAHVTSSSHGTWTDRTLRRIVGLVRRDA